MAFLNLQACGGPHENGFADVDHEDRMPTFELSARWDSVEHAGSPPSSDLGIPNTGKKKLKNKRLDVNRLAESSMQQTHEAAAEPHQERRKTESANSIKAHKEKEDSMQRLFQLLQEIQGEDARFDRQQSADYSMDDFRTAFQAGCEQSARARASNVLLSRTIAHIREIQQSEQGDPSEANAILEAAEAAQLGQEENLISPKSLGPLSTNDRATIMNVLLRCPPTRRPHLAGLLTSMLAQQPHRQHVPATVSDRTDACSFARSIVAAAEAPPQGRRLPPDDVAASVLNKSGQLQQPASMWHPRTSKYEMID